MKWLFILMMVLLQSLKSNSYPRGKTLIELLNNSNWIVEYTITNVSQYHAVIQITETFKGKTRKAMKVNQYMGSACGFRIDDYRVGQSGIMFLQLDSSSGTIDIMGDVNAGELIYKIGNFNKSLDSLISAQAGDFIFFDFLKLDVKNGIKEYFLNREKLEKLLFSGRIKTYSTSNPYMKLIINDMKKNRHLIKQK